MRSGNSQKGSVLIITLWILTILAFLGLQYSFTSRLNASFSISSCNGWINYLHGMEVVKYSQLLLIRSHKELRRISEEGGQIGWEEEDNVYLFPNCEEVKLKFPWGNAWIDVEDENGKLDLNKASREEIKDLLEKLEIPEDRADVIADSILDWRDKDNLSHLNGAEDDYYSGLKPPYHPPDGPFRTLTELSLVKGVGYELFWKKPGLWRFFTIYSQGGYDPKLAPPISQQETKGEREEEAPPPSLTDGHIYRFAVLMPAHNGKRALTLVWWGKFTGGRFKEVDKLVW